jgi:hypothetical protein
MILVIWKYRGYPFELDWKEWCEKHKEFKVTTDYKEQDADGYILLHGVTASYSEIKEIEQLNWLRTKKVKKLALTINAHKLRKERQKFFDRNEITIGSESDSGSTWNNAIWTPQGLNPDVYFEKVKRRDRPTLIGFRGHPYKHQKNMKDARQRIVNLFSRYSEVKVGIESFFHKREDWVNFLNSIKCIPSAESGHEGFKFMAPRHFDAIGTKTVQVMYEGRFGGILDTDNYIKLNLDHSNLDEVLEKIKDEEFCETLASRTREKMLDCHTINHRIEKILNWFG